MLLYDCESIDSKKETSERFIENDPSQTRFEDVGRRDELSSTPSFFPRRMGSRHLTTKLVGALTSPLGHPDGVNRWVVVGIRGYRGAVC